MEIFVQTLAHWKNKETLEFAVEYEFDGVEIVEGLYRDPENFDLEVFKEYKETFDFHYLYHVSPQFVLGDIYLFSQKYLVKNIEKALKICNELEIPFLTIHLFHYGSGNLPRNLRKKSYEITKDTIKKILPILEDYEIKLSLEISPNWDRETMFKCLTLRHAIKLIKEIGSDNLRLLYDAEHLYSTGTPPITGIKKIYRYLSYIHASDNDYSGIHMHLPLGKGRFPWKEIIDFLKKKGYNGPISIEATKKEDIIESKRFLIKAVK